MRAQIENIILAIQNLKAYKQKVFLAILGIVVAISSTITIVSIIEGFRFSVEKQFEGIGANRIIIIPFRPPGFKGHLLKSKKLDVDDAKLLKLKVRHISQLSPILRESMIVSYKNTSYYTLISGTDDKYSIINNHYVEKGRYFTPIDMRQRSPVCVVGKQVVKNLDIQAPVLGEKIKIKDQIFIIVGILEERGEMFGANIDDQVLIPFKTMTKIANKLNQKRIMITALAATIDDLDLAEDEIRDVLRRQHDLSAEMPDDFKIISQTGIVDTFSKTFSSVTLIVGGIVGISLIVGGIGIMNVMFSTVQERRKEIGIAMAIGARKIDVLMQFLYEAIIVCLAGGIIGIIVGKFSGLIFHNIPGFPEPHISLWLVAVTMCFSMVVGIVCGILPAIKAARLNPIDAIRYE